MNTKKTVEAMKMAVEDGDADQTLAAMHHDISEEIKGGSRPAKDFSAEPVVGSWIVVFTATFYHVGQLIADTHEYLVLAPGSASILDDTGPYRDFYGKGAVPEEHDREIVPTIKRIRKGVITEVNDWPFYRVPKVN